MQNLSDPPAGSVMIVNPGVQPELQRMAEGLERTGDLQSYVTAFSVGRDWTLPKWAVMFPNKIENKIMKQVSRRILDIPDVRIDRTSIISEAAFMALHKGNRFSGLQNFLLTFRNLDSQRSASRNVLESTQVIVGRSTSAMTIFRAAKELGVTTLLDYPIAHHNWSNRQIQREIQSFPEFQESLSSEIISPENCTALDQELSTADHILAFNDFHAQTFIEMGVDPSKIMVQHLGVDLEVFHPPTSPRVGERPFRVLFVGQLTQRKGIGYALRAFQAANIENSELIFVGRSIGRSADILSQDPRVQCIPHVDRRDLTSLYHTADVFLFPSIVEGFAQTPLEAMASGVPVLTSANAVGNSLLTEDYANFLVDPRDVPRISELLRQLHQNPGLRQKLAVKGMHLAQAFDNRKVSPLLARVALSVGSQQKRRVSANRTTQSPPAKS